MEVKGKKLQFARTLWVQFGGVKAHEGKDTVSIEGVDDESYLKVFNHFGRVHKLFTFEDGKWIDTDTGAEPTGLDESLAGHVAAEPAPIQSPPVSPQPKVSSPRRAASGKGKVSAKPKASKAAAAEKDAKGGKATTAKPKASKPKRAARPGRASGKR
jgi:hypothetical protein